MGAGHCGRVRESAQAVRGWPIWQLPRWLVGVVIAVTALYFAGLAVAWAAASPPSWRDIALCCALFVCSAATVEITKRIGENTGIVKDVYGVWDLPLAILLPPVYVLVTLIFRYALIQWRFRRAPLYRRVYTLAAVGLSYGTASVVFHLLTRQPFGAVSLPFSRPVAWVLAVACAGASQWTVNTALMLPAIKGSDPEAPRIRDLFFTRDRLHNDITEFCVAVLVALGIAVTPITIVFAFPFVTLLQRSFRHAQLVNASRMDSKTGLLNAGTWEREAASEVTRAVRTHTPLAVALIDVDHFKAVNDGYGHLVGDRTLQAISRTLTVFLREYDLVGRFGGEEFALLLPQTKPEDAYRIAERIRAYIAAMPIDAGDPGDKPVTVTVSVGVAALGNRWDVGTSQLTDLLAAADAALYRAKRDGRNQVRVVTEQATFGGFPQPLWPESANHQAMEISPSGEVPSPAPIPPPSEPRPPRSRPVGSPDPAA